MLVTTHLLRMCNPQQGSSGARGGGDDAVGGSNCQTLGFQVFNCILPILRVLSSVEIAYEIEDRGKEKKTEELKQMKSSERAKKRLFIKERKSTSAR